jgi:hypothetical protein
VEVGRKRVVRGRGWEFGGRKSRKMRRSVDGGDGESGRS